MTMYSLGVASMLTMISFATLAIDLKPHDKFLRENFEITDTKEIWGDDGWWVSCFFVDLDNDGFEEVISTTVSQTDRSGDASTFWTTKPDGKLHRLNEDNLLATNFFFASFHYSHYRLDLGGNRKCFIGLDMAAGYLNDDNATMRVKTPDCIFGIDAGNQLSVVPFSPSLDAVFFANATSRVERIYSEGFKGFDFKYVPRKTWFYGYEFPRTPDPIVPPERFNAFLSSFQKEVQTRSGVTNDVSVFAVLLDANNDGLTDCYLSSSVDGISKDVYRWMLFVNEKGVLKKAGGEVKSVPHREDLPSLEPNVEARKDAFCRVVRFDAPPTYIVLDESKIKDGLVKKTITNLLMHSIEKIPCHEYLPNALAENSSDCCKICESGVVTTSSTGSEPESECILREMSEESTPSDKLGKKIIRHKVRDDEDVTILWILYGMPSDEIRRRNKLKHDEDVRPGQIVELEVDQDFVDTL